MAQLHNRHLDESEIERYSMGHLREVEVAGFEEHLLVCEVCQQRLAETDEYVKSMRGAAERLRARHAWGTGQPEARWRVLHTFTAMAAVALLVIVIGWWSGNSDMTGVPPFALSLEATRGSGIAAYAPAD